LHFDDPSYNGMQDEVEQEVHMKSLTIVFALAGTLIGCASTPVKYEGDAKHSEAWNIARGEASYSTTAPVLPGLSRFRR